MNAHENERQVLIHSLEKTRASILASLDALSKSWKAFHDGIARKEEAILQRTYAASGLAGVVVNELNPVTPARLISKGVGKVIRLDLENAFRRCRNSLAALRFARRALERNMIPAGKILNEGLRFEYGAVRFRDIVRVMDIERRARKSVASAGASIATRTGPDIAGGQSPSIARLRGTRFWEGMKAEYNGMVDAAADLMTGFSREPKKNVVPAIMLALELADLGTWTDKVLTRLGESSLNSLDNECSEFVRQHAGMANTYNRLLRATESSLRILHSSSSRIT